MILLVVQDISRHQKYFIVFDPFLLQVFGALQVLMIYDLLDSRPLTCLSRKTPFHELVEVIAHALDRFYRFLFKVRLYEVMIHAAPGNVAAG